jgi:flagellar motility protein MotE (MotC chaperone)
MIKNWWIASSIGLISGSMEQGVTKARTVKESVSAPYIAEGEEQLFNKLKEEQKILIQKKLELQEREQMLSKEEKMIEEKIAYMEQKISSSEKIWEEIKEHMEDDQTQKEIFIKMIEKLPVRQAAPMMSMMDPSLAAKILKNFSPKRSASILSMMEPSKAAFVIEVLEQKMPVENTFSEGKKNAKPLQDEKNWVRTSKEE